MGYARRAAISSAVGVILVILILYLVDVSKLVAEMQKASLQWIGLYAASYPVFLLLRGLRWKVLLAHVNRDIRLKNTFWTTSVGYLVNTTLPLRLVGEFARAYVLDEKENTGFSTALSSVAVERILDLLGIAVIGLAGLMLMPESSSLPGWFSNILILMAIITIALLGLIIAGGRTEQLLIRGVDGLAARTLPSKVRKKVVDLTAQVVRGADGMSRSPKTLIYSLLLTLATWSTQIMATYAIFAAFQITPSFSIAMLGGMLVQLSFIFPAAPGFLGTYEGFWIFIFTVLGAGSNEMIVASGFLSHIISLFMVLVLGVVGAGILKVGVSTLIRLRHQRKESQPRLAPGELLSKREP